MSTVKSQRQNRKLPTPTRAEIDAQGVSTGVKFAGRCFGLSPETSYDRAREGEIVPGVPVIRSGSRYVVPTEPIKRKLGLDTTDGAA